MTKKHKYSGECPDCNLVLMQNECDCSRCGAKFPLTTPKKFVAKVCNCECDCDDDQICKCGNK